MKLKGMYFAIEEQLKDTEDVITKFIKDKDKRRILNSKSHKRGNLYIY
jgi:hypothetical protein